MTTETITALALNLLVKSPENVRKTHPDAGHAALKASIIADGLLQNLVVYPLETGKFAVAGGERRRQALAALAKEKRIPKTAPIPCLVRSRDEAVALSLAENTVREEMHPADAFAAFAALIDQGHSIEDIAARFGVTPAVVTRRLKLARLAPSIITAFWEGRISLDAVMGFTLSEHHAEQEAVFGEIEARGDGFEREEVLRLLTHEKVSTDDPLFVYVTEAAYCAAGGTISRDLFDRDGGGYADDSALLDRLALAKLTEAATTYRAGGWQWTTPTLSFGYELARGHARLHLKRQPLSSEDAARKTHLTARLHAIDEETGETEDGALSEERQQVEAELESIEAREYALDPAEMALAGGWVHLDYQGQPKAELGYVRREDGAAIEALHRQGGSQPARQEDASEDSTDHRADDHHTPKAAAATGNGLSDTLLTDLHAARTLALRLELVNRPDIALRAVAHSLAASIITHETTALRLTTSETYVSTDARTHCPNDEAVRRRLAHWRLCLPTERGALWTAILALSDESVLDIIALCAAVSIDGTYAKAPDHSTRQRMAHAAQLSETLQLDMSRHWTPTAESFFGRVSKATIRASVAEAAGESAAQRLDGLKKPVMAAAAQVVLGTGWVPEPLRTAVTA
jgi:ParB family chromosome partitioning protein